MGSLPKYLEELYQTGYLTKEHFTIGLSKYFRIVPDLVVDYPKLPTYLSLTMLTLSDINAINFANLEFVDVEAINDEANAPMVECYF